MNAESEYFMDWIEYDHGCNEWEGKMSDKLPQTMCLGGLQIVQITNLHVTIYKDGKRVFHCQCDKELDFAGLMGVIRFYKEMSGDEQEQSE